MSAHVSVSAIAFTGYPVTDIARARAFYEGILRLTPATQFEHGGKHWIEYEVGPATLALSNMSSDVWKPSADGPVLVLEVTDFDAAVAALREAAVTFALEPMDSGVCRLAIVLDPDGNSIGIHRRRNP